MTLVESLAAIAQGVINIRAGHTTVEEGSRVYRGMVAACNLIQPETQHNPKETDMIREVVQPEEQAAADRRQQMLNQLDKLNQLDPELVEVTVHANGRVTLDFLIDEPKKPLRQLARMLSRIESYCEMF